MGKKSIWQNTDSFSIKTLNRLDIKGKHLNIIKTMYDKSTANILHSEKQLHWIIKAKEKLPGSECLTQDGLISYFQKWIKYLGLYIYASLFFVHCAPKYYLHKEESFQACIIQESFHSLEKLILDTDVVPICMMLTMVCPCLKILNNFSSYEDQIPKHLFESQNHVQSQ